MLNLGVASTEEIARHEMVDRSVRQIRRALDHFIDENTIDYVTEGRRGYYFPSRYKKYIDEKPNEISMQSWRDNHMLGTEESH